MDEESIDYLLRFTIREVKKMEYLARKYRTAQEHRTRKPGTQAKQQSDIELMEGIEEKLQRARLRL